MQWLRFDASLVKFRSITLKKPIHHHQKFSQMIRDPDFLKIREGSFVYNLFGCEISHSKAPALHNFIFQKLGLKGFHYQILDSTDIDGFLQLLRLNDNVSDESDLKFNGAVVTMPYKVKMTEHVDMIDDAAKAVGAINTIYVRFDDNGKALNIGTNTDTFGVRDAFLVNAPLFVEACKTKSKIGLVYGGGGACRSAVYALHEYLGCERVYVVNRYAHEIDALIASMKGNGFKGEIVPVTTPDQAKRVTKPDLVVLTVPDFEPSSKEELLAKATLDVFIQQDAPGAVLEMCYHPNEITRLYRDFEVHGWKVISGVEAMIYQGIVQQTLWSGYPLEDMPIKEVTEHVYSMLHD